MQFCFLAGVYSNRKKFGECALECRDRSGNKQIMDCYSRTLSSKSEATFISLRELMKEIQRKGLHNAIVVMQNKNFLQKLLEDDCINWRLEPVFKVIRVLRSEFGNVLNYVDREYWNGFLNQFIAVSDYINITWEGHSLLVMFMLFLDFVFVLYLYPKVNKLLFE